MNRTSCYRKLLSVLLAVALLASLALPAFAANYTDLEGHWAKSYMETLAEKGLLTGYSDNTMRPGNNMTVREALVMLSRLFELSEPAVGFITEDYGVRAAAVNGAGADWAVSPIAVCFAGSITVDSELATMNLGANISREYLSLLVTRALGLMAQARQVTEFPEFNDLEQISESCRGAVAVLVQNGILTGDNNGNFRPLADITRGEVSALLSRALNYAAQNGRTFTLPNYEGLTQSEGLITTITTGRLVVTDFEGQQREYETTAETASQLDGATAQLNASFSGCYARIRERDRKAVQILALSKAKQPIVQGVITGMLAATDGYRISILPNGADSALTYNVPTTVEVMQNGYSSKFTSLSKGLNVTVWLNTADNTVAKIVSNTRAVEKTGAILSLSLDTTILLRIRDLNGAIWNYTLSFANMPRIEGNGQTVTIDRLKVDDNITVSSSNGEVTGIRSDLTFTEDATSGLLTSIATTLNGTVWTIQTSSQTLTYYATKATQAYNASGAVIPLDSINVGDHIKVLVSGDTIVEVSQQAATLAVEKITGRIVNVDTESQTVAMLTPESKVVYVGCAGIGGIVSSATGRQMAISSLKVNDNLLVYGRTATNNFAATLVIVES
ncbi:MAG: S-layer homology domain-containing protein [Oscillospiraceae bacterium]|nr:S-layer homology domain-containing protein [Oscillospiraceae bacterium]